MLNKRFAFVEFRSDSRYIHISFTQGVFFMKSVSKIFVRFVHINAFNVDEYAAAGYCRDMLPLKTLCCQCQILYDIC
jgi:hypothetical protein